MASPIEVVRPDRLIFMIGQPIIRLFASGGPGGDLGDLPRKKKVRNRVGSFDSLGCCGNGFSLADLACCGADEDEYSGIGQTTVPAPSNGASNGPTTLVDAAQSAVDQCQGIDDKVTQFLAAAKAADVTDPDQAKALRTQVQALKKMFRTCLRRLNAIVGPNKEKLKKSGMGQTVAYAQKQSDLQACRDKVTALQAQWTNHMKTAHGQ